MLTKEKAAELNEKFNSAVKLRAELMATPGYLSYTLGLPCQNYLLLKAKEEELNAVHNRWKIESYLAREEAQHGR